jgi:hypothetical protein
VAVSKAKEEDADAARLEAGWCSAELAVEAMYREVVGPFRVDAVHQRRFHACYPFAWYSLNQGLAARLLLEAGHEYVAQVNVRVAFESAVIAQWIMLTEGAEDRLVASLDRQHRNILRDLSRIAELPTALQRLRDDKTNPPALPNFEQLCDRFDKDKQVYVLYRVLSEAVHPSMATVAAHTLIDDKGAISLSPKSRISNSVDLIMAFAWSAVLAADVLETFRLGQPNLSQLRRIAQEGGLPSDLRHADVHPELQPADGPVPATA